MQSKASTVKAYLAELPAERREVIEAVRNVILANIDPLIEEGMQYGMIGYCVPHKVFPLGYHCDPRIPLPYAALAAQKNYYSLYLMSEYADGTDQESGFRKDWAKTGKKLDMGKCCIRFKRVDDLALDVIAKAFKRSTVKDHLAMYAKVDPRQGAGGGLRTVGKNSVPKATKKATKKAGQQR